VTHKHNHNNCNGNDAITNVNAITFMMQLVGEAMERYSASNLATNGSSEHNPFTKNVLKPCIKSALVQVCIFNSWWNK